MAASGRMANPGIARGQIYFTTFEAVLTASRDSFRTPIQPHDAQLIRQLIAATRPMNVIGERMKYISGQLLGLPYVRNPLIGSATEAEIFVTRMDGFDCVTFLETVLALARSKSLEDFLVTLRQIRYRNGEVDYRQRLHYLTDWASSQVQRGLLVDLTIGEDTILREKRLDWVKSVEPKMARFRYFPRHQLTLVSRWLRDGDLIYFVSGRAGLDTLHAGLLVREGDRVLMRHATRHRHKVVEQELSNFCGQTPMSGFIINRPKDF